jgi:hypothetical protein
MKYIEVIKITAESIQRNIKMRAEQKKKPKSQRIKVCPIPVRTYCVDDYKRNGKPVKGYCVKPHSRKCKGEAPAPHVVVHQKKTTKIERAGRIIREGKRSPSLDYTMRKEGELHGFDVAQPKTKLRAYKTKTVVMPHKGLSEIKKDIKRNITYRPHAARERPWQRKQKPNPFEGF